MISMSCPHCTSTVTAKDRLTGKLIRCPFCRKAVRMRDESEQINEPDDEPEEDRPRRRGRNGFRCPFCGSSAEPSPRSKIATGGWVFFGLFMFAGILSFLFSIIAWPFICVAFPLFPIAFLGFLIQSTRCFCDNCGMIIGDSV